VIVPVDVLNTSLACVEEQQQQQQLTVAAAATGMIQRHGVPTTAKGWPHLSLTRATTFRNLLLWYGCSPVHSSTAVQRYRSTAVRPLDSLGEGDVVAGDIGQLLSSQPHQLRVSGG
jgi:hypothetical protein